MPEPSIPLPWKVNKREGASARGPLAEIADATGLRQVAACGGDNRRVNADYIVEACNHYPGMLQAIRAALKHLNNACNDDEWSINQNNDIGSAIRVLQEAYRV